MTPPHLWPPPARMESSSCCSFRCSSVAFCQQPVFEGRVLDAATALTATAAAGRSHLLTTCILRLPAIVCCPADLRLSLSIPLPDKVLQLSIPVPARQRAVNQQTCWSLARQRSTSESDVVVLRLQVRLQAWRLLAEMRHHSCPAISLAHLAWPDSPQLGNPAAEEAAAGHPGAQAAAARHLLFSGGTDGSIAVWDIAAAVQSVSCSSGGGGTAGVSQGSGSSCNATHVDCGATEAAAAIMPLEPLAVLQGVHQSGVNGLAAAWLRSHPGAATAAPPQADAAAQGAAVSNGLDPLGLRAPDSVSSSVGSCTADGSNSTVILGCGGSGGSDSSRTAVLVSGGDDQVLAVTAVAFGAGGPAWPPSAPLPAALPADAACSSGAAAAAAASSVAAGSQQQHEAAASGHAGAPANAAPPAEVTVGAVQRLPNAHASALRAVWTDGDRVFSTGLDQRVRCWRIEAEPADNGDSGAAAAEEVQPRAGNSMAGAKPEVAPAPAEGPSNTAAELPRLIFTQNAAEVVQVLEPSSLAVAAAGNSTFLVAVAGRGLQMLTI